MTADLIARARAGDRLDQLAIFDCHGHIGPSFIHHIPGNDAEAVVASMDRLGIAQLCVSAHASIMGDHRGGNDLVAEAVRRFPGRILGYACYNPRDGVEEGEREMARCFERLGFHAVKIHPQFQAYPADGPGFRPAWETAARRGCPLLTHTLGGDPHCSPSRFGPLARAYPGVPILLGHAGNNLRGVDEAVAVAAEHDNVFLDLNYATVHHVMVERLWRRLGAGKLVFGSDVSWNSLAFSLGLILMAEIPDSDKERILRLNAPRSSGYARRRPFRERGPGGQREHAAADRVVQPAGAVLATPVLGDVVD